MESKRWGKSLVVYYIEILILEIVEEISWIPCQVLYTGINLNGTLLTLYDTKWKKCIDV